MKIRIHNRSEKCNNNRAVKAKAAMPIAGILAAVALMSGLLFLIGSEIAIAQQNMTATNATTTAGNATGMMAGNQTAGNATGMMAGNQTAAGNQTTAGTSGGNSSDPLSGIYGMG